MYDTFGAVMVRLAYGWLSQGPGLNTHRYRHIPVLLLKPWPDLSFVLSAGSPNGIRD